METEKRKKMKLTKQRLKEIIKEMIKDHPEAVVSAPGLSYRDDAGEVLLDLWSDALPAIAKLLMQLRKTEPVRAAELKNAYDLLQDFIEETV